MFSRALFAFSLFVAACGSDADPSPAPSAASTPAPRKPTADFVAVAGATIDFHATVTYARRDASKNVATFLPADHYDLLVSGSTTSPTRITSVGIGFDGTVATGVEISIDDTHVDATGALTGKHDGVELYLYGESPAPVPVPIAHASVTVHALPGYEGGKLSADVRVYFTDGELFGGTISGELTSSCLCNVE